MYSGLTSKDIIYKQPDEKFQVRMNFSNVLRYGDVIEGNPSVTVEPSGEVILSALFATEDMAYATVAEGSVGDYRLQFEVNTSSGNIYVADGLLKVRDR